MTEVLLVAAAVLAAADVALAFLLAWAVDGLSPGRHGARLLAAVTLLSAVAALAVAIRMVGDPGGRWFAVMLLPAPLAAASLAAARPLPGTSPRDDPLEYFGMLAAFAAPPALAAAGGAAV